MNQKQIFENWQKNIQDSAKWLNENEQQDYEDKLLFKSMVLIYRNTNKNTISEQQKQLNVLLETNEKWFQSIEDFNNKINELMFKKVIEKENAFLFFKKNKEKIVPKEMIEIFDADDGKAFRDFMTYTNNHFDIYLEKNTITRKCDDIYSKISKFLRKTKEQNAKNKELFDLLNQLKTWLMTNNHHGLKSEVVNKMLLNISDDITWLETQILLEENEIVLLQQKMDNQLFLKKMLSDVIINVGHILTNYETSYKSEKLKRNLNKIVDNKDGNWGYIVCTKHNMNLLNTLQKISKEMLQLKA